MVVTLMVTLRCAYLPYPAAAVRLLARAVDDPHNWQRQLLFCSITRRMTVAPHFESISSCADQCGSRCKFECAGCKCSCHSAQSMA